MLLSRKEMHVSETRSQCVTRSNQYQKRQYDRRKASSSQISLKYCRASGGWKNFCEFRRFLARLVGGARRSATSLWFDRVNGKTKVKVALKISKELKKTSFRAKSNRFLKT